MQLVSAVESVGFWSRGLGARFGAPAEARGPKATVAQPATRLGKMQRFKAYARLSVAKLHPLTGSTDMSRTCWFCVCVFSTATAVGSLQGLGRCELARGSAVWDALA